MGDYRVISSDDHVFEPVDLWISRAPAKFKDRMPHIESLDTGDWWYCDGHMVSSTGAGSQAGMRFDDHSNIKGATTVEQVRPGGWIPEEHIKDMDLDGIDVSIVFPTVGLDIYQNIPESDLMSEIFRIYNDWVAEFCKAFPDRLKGIAMINVDEVKEGVKELGRCANMGMRGAMIPVYPLPSRQYSRPEYDPFWAAAQDLQIPISLHITTNRAGPGAQLLSGTQTVSHPADITNADHWPRMSLAHMIFGGVFYRFPNLQVGSIEQELSWAPHFLDRLDYTYTQRAPRDDWWGAYKGDKLPSEYFKSNVHLGFQEDGLGIKLRDLIGVDTLMWGSDYPHVESTFPRSREILEEILSDCTEEEKAKIAGGNAARVYNLN